MFPVNFSYYKDAYPPSAKLRLITAEETVVGSAPFIVQSVIKAYIAS